MKSNFRRKNLIALLFILFFWNNLKAQTVFVTSKGKKYHALDCAKLKQDKKALSIEEANKMGYRAHKHCLEKQMKKIKMAEEEEKRKKTETETIK